MRLPPPSFPVLASLSFHLFPRLPDVIYNGGELVQQPELRHGHVLRDPADVQGEVRLQGVRGYK